MSKSKSDILLALALALLGGCDAFRTPVPEDPPTPIRASLAGFVVEGGAPQIFVARPVDDPSESTLRFPWIDESASKVLVEQDVGSGVKRLYQFTFWEDVGLKGYAYLRQATTSKIERIHGCLRWNASTPYRVSSDGMISDSFDLRPQTGLRVGFKRDRVRGDLCLRWPRLAAANEFLRSVWKKNSDSLRNLSEEWAGICRRRGDADAHLLVLDTTVSPFVYRWKELDTAVLRLALAGGGVQVVFSEGDSIWLPVGRRADMFVDLDTVSLLPLLVEQSTEAASSAYDWAHRSFATRTNVEQHTDRMLWFGLYDYSSERIVFDPMLLRLRIAGTCPAFADWRRYGPTDRWHRPTGNVAPFDGYLCEIFPDTLSFPRGDVVLNPWDTTSQTKVVKVDSTTTQPTISTP